VSPELTRYRELEEALREVRRHNEFGSRLEDPIIAEGAELWWKLTQEERDMLDAEGPTCIPECKFEVVGDRCYFNGQYCGSVKAIEKLNLYPEEKKEG